MARIAFGCTLGGSLGEGRFSSSSGAVAPALTSTTTADTDVGNAQGLEAAVTSAVSAAAANGTIAGDGTALGLVQAIQTAFDLLIASLVTAKAATVAAKSAAAPANVVLDIDTAVVTTKNGVRAAVRELLRSVDGSGMAS